MKISRAAVLGTLVILITGCAALSEDGGFGPVEQITTENLDKEVRWVRSDAERDEVDTRIADLLAAPLSANSAVQIALLNNRSLQAGFEALGITEAERVQAGRLSNPGFTFGKTQRGSEREIERGFHFNLAQLFFLPTINKMESRRLARMQQDVALQVLDLASQTRKAWIRAVSAQENARYMRKVMELADVSADLARRMVRAGNFSKLQQAREQSVYADAAVNLARADNAALAARERLTRLLALYGENAGFRLPDRLPLLPEEPGQYPAAVKTALAQRLDVQAARINVEQLAQNLGMVRTNRFINVLEVGTVYNTSNEEPRQTGWEIGFELPLFDWGSAKVAKADGLYRQAMNEAAQTAIEARSEVRQAYAGYRSAYDIARHYQNEIVPLHQRISEENQYRYNGMIIGVFALLADVRSQIGTVIGYIQARQDYWLAQADLDMAMIGKPGLGAMTAAASSGNDDNAGEH